MDLPKEIILKLLLSVLVGGAIGIEREFRSKSAGFRTLTMICLGATLFTVFSKLLGEHTAPERIASNVVVGIGFVGAGVIFKGDNKVNGITTASLIWVTAALGMGIGAGYMLVSTMSCALILVVLYIFTKLESRIDSISQIRNYKIVCEYQDETLVRFEVAFKDHNLSYVRRRETKAGELITGEWTVKGPEKNHLRFIDAVIKDPTVKAFEF